MGSIVNSFIEVADSGEVRMDGEKGWRIIDENDRITDVWLCPSCGSPITGRCIQCEGEFLDTEKPRDPYFQFESDGC